MSALQQRLKAEERLRGTADDWLNLAHSQDIIAYDWQTIVKLTVFLDVLFDR